VRRKYPPLDVVKLIAQWDTSLWNDFLTKCLENRDVERLKSTLYGMQYGMDLAVKQKLNSDKMTNTFLRMTRSIEITLKKILRVTYPSPLDQKSTGDNVDDFEKHIIAKRKRDIEFERFLRDSRF